MKQLAPMLERRREGPADLAGAGRLTLKAAWLNQTVFLHVVRDNRELHVAVVLGQSAMAEVSFQDLLAQSSERRGDVVRSQHDFDQTDPVLIA